LLGQASQICPGGIDTPLGRRIYSDGWDGYPRARERLVQSIAQARGGNVVCLSGDVHRHMAAQLRAQGNQRNSPVVAGEFVCSSVTSHGVSEAVMALMRSSNPDIVHGRSDERGYALIDVTPGAATCEFRATPFPAKADVRLTTQARFAIEDGRPGIATA
jgi:alkaline phosphatase D